MSSSGFLKLSTAQRRSSNSRWTRLSWRTNTVEKSVPLGKYCLFYTVSIFVGAPLPWATGVRKVQLDAGIDGELFMPSHFFSLVVGPRFSYFCG